MAATQEVGEIFLCRKSRVKSDRADWGKTVMEALRVCTFRGYIFRSDEETSLADSKKGFRRSDSIFPKQEILDALGVCLRDCDSKGNRRRWLTPVRYEIRGSWAVRMAGGPVS